MVLPLALLRRLPARQEGGGLATFLGLAEQLATEAAPAARMGLRRAYVPAGSVGHAAATLPLRAVALPAPGCGRRLRHLPRLDAAVVRLGFPGICLTLADGRSGRVTGQREQLREETLQVEAEGTALEIPLRHFGLPVRDWHSPAKA